MSGARCTVVFRRTGHNHYTLNALLGLLDEVLDPGLFEVEVAGSLSELVGRLSAARAAGRRPVAAWSFTSLGRPAAGGELAAARAAAPGALLIAGGPHATARPRDILEAGADAVFRGEAEESLPAFLGSLAGTGGGQDGAAAVHRHGGIVDPLPLAGFDRYPPFAWRRGLFGPVELMRGCACRCAFCQTPRLFPVCRERSVDGVLEQARRLKAAGKRRLFFIAPDILSYGMRSGRVSEERLGRLLEGVCALGLLPHLGDFPSEVSPATAARHPGVFRPLRALVHNRRMVLGVQSGSDRVLRLMGRPHTVDDGRAAVEAIRAAGFRVLIDLLFGTPGEGREGREETLAFIRSYAAEPRVTFHLHYLLPLPGTPLEGSRPEPLEPEVRQALAGLVSGGRADGEYLFQMAHGEALRAGGCPAGAAGR
jgi:B12-binding domain/radical SAM domain protein